MVCFLPEQLSELEEKQEWTALAFAQSILC